LNSDPLNRFRAGIDRESTGSRGLDHGQWGSLYLRWGHESRGVGKSASDEEHAEAVVVAVAEAAGDAAVELDEAVDGFGAAVVCAGGGEVDQERLAPLLQGPARRAISGIGQDENEAITCSAIRRPSAGVSWWNAERSSWPACQAIWISSTAE